LTAAGTADLTAHVDFQDMAAAARSAGADAQGPVTQGAFLTALGLAQRTEALIAAGGDPIALRAAAARLSGPTAMGALFKVMAVVPPRCPGLPGVSAG
jgi:SAM-dependent MidA family methyltransferase